MSETVAEKSKKGILSLSVRSLLINGLQVVSVLVLSKLLYPKDYGIFGILNAWVGTAFYLSDIGITGALIRQSEEPTKEQLQSQFSVQLFLTSMLCLIFWFFAPIIAQENKLSSDAVTMLRIMGLTLPITALRANPRLMFERQLKYGVLARVDLGEALAMYCVQITLAIFGFGAWSFVIANISRSITGTVLIFLNYSKTCLPIPSWKEIKKLLPFGLPFQANALLPALHGLVLPLVLARILSVKEIGVLLWTLGLVSIPIFLASNYNQVIYSSLSRLQADSAEMRRVASRSTELAILAFGFVFSLGASCCIFIVNHLFDSKWADAKTIMPVAIVAVFFSTIRYLCAPILNSSGRPSLRLKIEGVSTIAEFILAWFFVRLFGVIGYLYATMILNFIMLCVSALAIRADLRKETFQRFFYVLLAGGVPFFILHLAGWQNHVLHSMFIFLIMFFGILFALDKQARSDSRNLAREIYFLLRLSIKRSEG